MTNQASDPIGIFDSGVGGLTVASAVRQLIPERSIVYFGDTAHLPYGDKSPGAILHYSKKITDFLLDHNCKIILAACNTVSATVWDELNLYISGRAVPVNVIDPVVKRVGELYSGLSIGVIGTKNTINSGAYTKKIKEIIPGAKVSSLATPLMVPMIEEGFVYDDISNAIIRAYLSNSTLEGIQTLILGCTHYPIIRNQIRKYYDFKVDVVDSALIVAEHVRSLIDSLLPAGSKAGSVSHSLPGYPDKVDGTGGPLNAGRDKFFVSDYTEYFSKIAGIFFEKEIILEKVDLWR